MADWEIDDIPTTETDLENVAYVEGIRPDGTPVKIPVSLLGGGGAFRGCRLYRASAQSVTTGSAQTLTWDTESFDTDTFHDNSTNNSRITIPSGVSKVVVTANIRREVDAGGNANFLYI